MFGLAPGELTRDKHLQTNFPRVLAFALNGKDHLPEAAPPPVMTLRPPPDTASDAVIASGKNRFHFYCGTCHGDTAVRAGLLPDLRYSPALYDEKSWQSIVHDGALRERGMIGFAAELSAPDIDAIRAYIIRRAHESQPTASAP